MPAHRYTTCGLSSVFLADGYAETPSVADADAGVVVGVAVEDVVGLHGAIGAWVVGLPRPLTGEELRFLRTELGFSADVLGRLAGVDGDGVRAHESARGRPLADPALDRLVRLLFVEHSAGHVDVAAALLDMARNDGVAPETALFQWSADGWRRVVVN
jgi:hypothetical protein